MGTPRQQENVRRLLRNWRGLPHRELAVRLRGLRAADRMGLVSPDDRHRMLEIQAELDGVAGSRCAVTTTHSRRE